MDGPRSPPPGPIASAASESKRSGWIPSPGYSSTSVSIHVLVFPAPSQTIFFLILSWIQRAAQTVLDVYLKRSCSRVTSASSALGVLNDYALYKSTHSLTHSLCYSFRVVSFLVMSCFAESLHVLLCLGQSAHWQFLSQ